MANHAAAASAHRIRSVLTIPFLRGPPLQRGPVDVKSPAR
jgi:hypothetical protein